MIKKPFILTLFGFPGAGKTSFARQFCEEFGLVHLQEDKLSQEFFGSSSDEKLQQKAMHYLAGELLRCGLPIVYDSSKSTKTRARKALKQLAAHNKAISIVVWFQIDPDTAYARLQHRDRRKIDDKYAKAYTDETFQNILSGQQNPKPDENYAVISGKHTYRSQRNAVLKRLFDLNLVEASQVSNSNVVKPGLVNLIPNRGDIKRRNISIR